MDPNQPKALPQPNKLGSLPPTLTADAGARSKIGRRALFAASAVIVSLGLVAMFAPQNSWMLSLDATEIADPGLTEIIMVVGSILMAGASFLIGLLLVILATLGYAEVRVGRAAAALIVGVLSAPFAYFVVLYAAMWVLQPFAASSGVTAVGLSVCLWVLAPISGIVWVLVLALAPWHEGDPSGLPWLIGRSR